MRGLLLLLAAVACAADQPFEDSPALTALWQATSDGSTDAYIQQLIQNREYGSHRAADGRGPMFWAYEFKNLDARALLMHLEVSPEQEDVDGKKPKEFFSGTKEELAEFEADAKAKAEELGALLSEREEEFYSYQNSHSSADDDDYDDEEDDEDDDKPKKPKPPVDSIDYADDEEEEDDKDEM